MGLGLGPVVRGLHFHALGWNLPQPVRLGILFAGLVHRAPFYGGHYNHTFNAANVRAWGAGPRYATSRNYAHGVYTGRGACVAPSTRAQRWRTTVSADSGALVDSVAAGIPWRWIPWRRRLPRGGVASTAVEVGGSHGGGGGGHAGRWPEKDGGAESRPFFIGQIGLAVAALGPTGRLDREREQKLVHGPGCIQAVRIRPGVNLPSAAATIRRNVYETIWLSTQFHA